MTESCQQPIVLRAVNNRSVLAVCSALIGHLASRAGRRSFPVAGACIWNDLPSDVTSSPSVLTFHLSNN